jgi:hypothetical protein
LFVCICEGVRNTKLLGNLLGILLATTGDGHDLKVRQKLENGNVAITAPIPDSHDSGPDLSLVVRVHENCPDQYLNLSAYFLAKSASVLGFRPTMAGRLSKTSSDLGILPAVKSV